VVGMRLSRRWTLSGLLCLATSVALVGCGANAGGSTTPTAKATPTLNPGGSGLKVDTALRAMLPASIRNGGVLKAASGLAFPPYDYQPATGPVTGIEPDLLYDIGDLLGLKVTITQIQFPSLISSVQNDRFQIGLDQLGDFAVREQAIDFVDYLKSSDSLLTQVGNPHHLTIGDTEQAGDLCGTTLAFVDATGETIWANGYSAVCKQNGKPPITQQLYTTSAAQQLAVEDDRAEGAPVEIAVAAYLAAHSTGKMETLTTQLPGKHATIGIGVEKNIGLTNVIYKAMQILFNDGQYKHILAEWQDSGDAVSHPAINDITLYQG
jgi:polar amino acid transport system substrate-binding protein